MGDDPDQGEGDSYMSEDHPPTTNEPKKPDKSRHEEHRGKHYQEVRGLHATGALDHRIHETGVSSAPMNDHGAKQDQRRGDQAQLEQLAGIIMFGIPGEKKQTIEQMREKLDTYKDIDHATLREHLKYFLQEISPLADELEIQ